MFKVSETHSAATWLLHPLAPKVERPIGVGRKQVMANE
jgi:oligopeptide transport system ATP-binding protein